MCHKILEGRNVPQLMDRSTTLKQLAKFGCLLPFKRLLFIQACEDSRKNLIILMKTSKSRMKTLKSQKYIFAAESSHLADSSRRSFDP